jgi:hypothetical protein
VTQIAPTLGGAGDTVNARDREQFEEFMTSRWPGLVRLFDSAGHVFAITTSVPLPK